MKKRSYLYGSCILLQGLIYGYGNVITKFAYETISPFWCLTMRFGGATLLLMAFFGPAIVRDLKTSKVRWWLPSGICMALGYITCNVALFFTDATTVGFLMALPVIFTPLFALIVLKHRYRTFYVFIQVLVVTGLYLFCSNGGGFSFGLGEALSLFTSVAVAGALVFGEKGLKSLKVVTITTTQTFLTFVISLAGALVLEPDFAFSGVSTTAWLIVVYLAVPCTCLAFALQNIALTGITSTTVAVLATAEPILTAVFAGFMLGETLTPIAIIGAAIILFCILATTVEPTLRPASPLPKTLKE